MEITVITFASIAVLAISRAFFIRLNAEFKKAEDELTKRFEE
jgi:hypothetical protein